MMPIPRYDAPNIDAKFQALIDAPDDSRDYEHRREKELTRLIPRLNSQQKRQLLNFAGTIGGSQKHWQQIKLVTALYPYLQAELRVEAYHFVLEGVILARDDKALKQGDGEWDFREFVTVAAGHLTPTDRKRLLQTIYTFKGAYSRVRALLKLLPHMDADAQEHIHQHALDSVMQVRSGMPDSDDVSYQVGILIEMVRILPETFLAKAVEVAQQLKSNREKSFALGDIALRMQGADKQAVLQLALDAALGYPPINSIESFVMDECFSAFIRLAPHLTGDLALQAAERLPDYHPFGTDENAKPFERYLENAKRRAAAALAPNLPEAAVKTLMTAMGKAD